MRLNRYMAHKYLFCTFFVGPLLRRPGLATWKQLECLRESLEMPLDDHPITLRIRTQPPPASSQQVPKSYSFFYHITCICTHRRVIKLQHVALYDAYMLSFLIDTLCQRASVHRDMP